MVINSHGDTSVRPYTSELKTHPRRVDWGKVSMVDAEKRLLANALEDPDNQHFVLLSHRFARTKVDGNGKTKKVTTVAGNAGAGA
ncbi:putative glycosyl transferase 14 [Tanacetum coccineum]